MPTYQPRPRFLRDFKSLTAAQVAAWEKTLDAFVACLRSGRFEPSLRVKRVQGYPGVWEITWAADGRATFEYGQEIRPGEQHIIWRRMALTTSFASRKDRPHAKLPPSVGRRATGTFRKPRWWPRHVRC